MEFALQNSQLYFDNIWCYKKGANSIKTEKVDGIFKYMRFIEREQKELDFIEVLFNKIENGVFIIKGITALPMKNDVKNFKNCII